MGPGYAKPGYEKTKGGLKYRDYYQEAKNNLLKQAPNLSGIRFVCADYSRSIAGAMIYCDPPYQGTKQFANSKDFDYERFWNQVRVWSEKNIVLVSEQNAPDDFECIWEQEVSRSIKAADKSRATEKLFKLRKCSFHGERM